MAPRLRAQLVIRCLAGLAALAVLGGLGAVLPTPASGTPRAAAATAAPEPNAPRAGITPGSTILWESDADLNRDLDAVRASGARWISIDVDWNSIQSDGPDSWRWQTTDRIVLAAKARGLQILGTLAYTPRWAVTPDCPPDTTHCLPEQVGDYARFAFGAAWRYGINSPYAELRGTVDAWAIWNEPNGSDFSRPRPDPVRYTAMLRAAYPLVKGVDPPSTVITGGTSPAGDEPDGSQYSPARWLGLLYLNGARGSFDAVGHHPYSFPTAPIEAHPWNAFTQTLDIRGVMMFFGDATKKIWGTEAGAPTGTSSVAISEAQQAQWVHDYYDAWNTAYADFTGPLFWFSQRDSGADRSQWLQNLGLLRRDFSRKPAFAAYRAVTGAGNDSSVTARTGTRVAVNPRGGEYVLGADGTITANGGAPWYGAPRIAGGRARGIAVMPDGRGYVVVDAAGNVSKFGSARTGAMGLARTPVWSGQDLVRDVAVTPDGRGLAVLDAFGGIHGSKYAPRLSAGYWPGWRIARALEFTPSGRGVYVLDGFGGVHVAGDAVVRRGPYWRGWDIARDLTVTPSGRGYAVLDGFGSVHPTGDAPKPGANAAYRAIDHAGGLALDQGRYLVAG